MMEAIGDTDEWRGTTKYNLACYYALEGDVQAAIGILTEAFELNPKLLPWAEQDTDLDSLRALEEFKALLPADSS